MIDQSLARFAPNDPRSHNVKPSAKTPAVNSRKKVEAAKPTDKPQAGQPARASKSSPLDNKSVNDYQANQQKNMELRGAVLFLYPMGTGSPVAPGVCDAAESNVFMINLTGPWSIDFDWSKHDAMIGSKRANYRVDRVIPMTLRIKHNGHAISFAAGTNIHWPDGEAPDLTPDAGGAGIHIINVLCFRTGIHTNAPVNEVHASVWAPNSRMPA